MSRERDRSNSKSSRQQDMLIKLRGIPSNSSRETIKKFLYPCRVVNVHLFHNDGQTTNQCFVDLDSERDLRDALKKHRTSFEKRTIEVVQATNYEFKFFMRNKGTKSWRDPVLRIDGLPITCTMGDIQNFFKGIEIATNGIYISRDMSDNASGGGYVAFVDMETACKAAERFDRQYLQDSRIDLVPSTYDDAKATIVNDAIRNGKRFADEPVDEENKTNELTQVKKPDQRGSTTKRRRSSSGSPKDQRRPEKKSLKRSRSPVRRASPQPNRKGEYVIKMRGMPFTVKESDVTNFFPSSCRPVRIEILHDRRTEKPNGDGFAYFKSRDEAYEAIKCHRKYMGKRYVELYFESTEKRSKSLSHSPIEDEPHEEEEQEQQEEQEEQEEETEEAEEENDERSPSRSESDH